ncbi:MAG TPA: serine/threonine protein kinase [Desulfobacteraceae bacterium]|nr:serine/threonine protein kinase [Desulfobacteraceae bacterium]
MKCEREPGGRKAHLQEGVCPAAADTTFTGINAGLNAGRFCWAVTGTPCSNLVHEDYAQKRSQCRDCEFYHMVIAEEGTRNLRTKFLRFIQGVGIGPSVLWGVSRIIIPSGERFVFQGKNMDEAYIIKTGACIVLVEKDGDIHPADHRCEGDLVNMSALFTGEPSMAHVEAETEVEAWVIKKEDFNRIPESDPDLWEFLTEVVADRFDSRRPTSYRTIGHYMTTNIIGRGGYSIVYKGIDLNTGKEVAIKMMRHHRVMDSDFLTKFKKEADILDRMTHDHIIRVHDMVERYRTLFIIMEYLEGESIQEKLHRQGSIPHAQATDYLLQACSAIEYAYEQDVLHKDINPGNLMVDQNNHLKLVDFGLACPVQEDDELLDGAFLYLAPELIKGERASLQSEIYALGITAYEMAIGKRPYPEDDPAHLTRMRCEKEIPSTQLSVPGLPDHLTRFIVRACRLDPTERFDTMEDAITLLRTGKNHQ